MFGVKLKVWGDYACFTRPEMKVERVSYDVMTPSAARAVLEAIYWKPAIRWIIEKIRVLKPVKFTNIRRNEVASKITLGTVKSAMKGTREPPMLFIEDDRQQRAATVLKNVEYVIEAHFEILSPDELKRKGYNPDDFKDENNEGKHLDIFNRRARKGQCFKQPYLGCREFTANFELMEGDAPESDVGDRELGFMLYDINFTDEMNAMFFRAEMKNGVVEIPHPDSEEVLR